MGHDAVKHRSAQTIGRSVRTISTKKEREKKKEGRQVDATKKQTDCGE